MTGDDGTGLVVDPRAKEALAKVDKPVVVVSVVGMYRTGKSFLLNRLMNRTDGFPLGATVQAKTNEADDNKNKNKEEKKKNQ